jgi:translation elongation factor EF-G
MVPPARPASLKRYFSQPAISAKGSVEKGNTVADFDAQEKEAGHSSRPR